MSIKIMALVWDSDLPSNEKFVALCYADFADDDGRNIYPAVETVARKTGYSTRQVQRLARSLADQAILIEEGQGPQARADKRTVMWRLDTNALPQRGDNLSPRNESGVTPMSPDPLYKTIEESTSKSTTEVSTTTSAYTSLIASTKEEDQESTKIARTREKERACPDADPDLGVEIPPHLRTEDFWTIWQMWKKERKEVIKKPLSARAAKMQLGKLGQFHEKVAVEMIKRSIEGSWQGIFVLPDRHPVMRQYGAHNYQSEIPNADASNTSDLGPIT